MTERRKQKRRIRDRMARTGESYSSARAWLLKRARTTVAAPPVVMIPVVDMSRAIAFYRDALGFSVRGRNAEDSWAYLGDDNLTIGLHGGAATRGVETGIGLRVADLASTRRAVVGCGGREVSDMAPAPVVVIEDPDGNRLTLMGPT